MTEQRGGRAPDPDVVREEAERLVGAGLTAMSMVADRIGAPTRQRGGPAAAGYDALGDMLFGPTHRRHSVATGSEDCCRCPVCRVISAARDPNPDVAEKLATGVGTLAGGAARLAREVAGAVGAVWPAPAGSATDATEPAREAAGSAAGDQRPRVDDDPWAAATAAGAEPAVAETPVAKKPVAKKAVAKKPVARKPVAKKPVAKKPEAQQEPGTPQPPGATDGGDR